MFQLSVTGMFNKGSRLEAGALSFQPLPSFLCVLLAGLCTYQQKPIKILQLWQATPELKAHLIATYQKVRF